MFARLGLLSLRIPWPVRIGCCSLYSALMTWLLLAPANVVTGLYPMWRGFDKVLHFLLFGFLVLLVRWAFKDPRTLTFRAWLVPLAALAYGIATEVAQGRFVSYDRAFEWSDIAANGFGAATFWAFSAVLFPPEARRTSIEDPGRRPC